MRGPMGGLIFNHSSNARRVCSSPSFGSRIRNSFFTGAVGGSARFVVARNVDLSAISPEEMKRRLKRNGDHKVTFKASVDKDLH